MSKERLVRKVVSLLVCGFSACCAYATSGVMQVTGSRILSENHTGTVVLGANATLNCNGRKILNGTQGNVCGNNDRSCGVLMKQNNATVRNCTIEGFNTGIDVIGVMSPTIDNNQIYENTVGIRIRNVFGGGRNVISNTIMESAEEGLNIDDSTNLNFIDNHISYNGRDGVDVGNSQTLVFRDNRITDNTLNGIELDGSSFNALIKNYLSHNGRSQQRSGISLGTSDFNRLACNTSNRNGRNGIRINDGSDSNIIEKNSATRNVQGDAFESADSRFNSWTGNVFKDRGQSGTPDCANVN